MSYDTDGLGISELGFIAVNYPEAYETIMQAPDDFVLKLARKFIEAVNKNLIGG